MIGASHAAVRVKLRSVIILPRRRCRDPTLCFTAGYAGGGHRTDHPAPSGGYPQPAAILAESQAYNHRFPHPFTTTWGDLSSGSHYYGVDYGPVHVISLNNYVPFGAGTPQVRRRPLDAPLARPSPACAVRTRRSRPSALGPARSNTHGRVPCW